MTDVDARKNCPYENESEVRSRYLAGTLSEAEAEAYERHYFYCPACAEAIEVGTRLRAGFGKRPVEIGTRAAPPRLGRAWLALAAAAAAALIAVGVLQMAHRTPAAPASVLRSGGDAPQDVRVEAAGDGALNVRWTAVAGASRYTVRVLSSDGLEIWKTETPEPRATVRRADLPSGAGKTLRVEVEALDARGRVLGTSEPAAVR